MSGPARLEVEAVEGLGEVGEGADLAALVVALTTLADGDVLVVTSKVVSKAEGRVVVGDRETALTAETDRVVARRGRTTIVRTHHGLVMAAAGIDASNTAPGTAVLLPRDPDLSARRLRERLLDLTGRNVAVVVSDTAGRAWRTGQTDLAVGAAGLVVLDDHAGRVDPYGNPLAVTAPALADEVAGAGDLVKGKLGRTPVARLRGLSAQVLPAGQHGPGAAALVRPETEDLFGYGAREAVRRAVAGDATRGFGEVASAAEVTAALTALLDASRAGEASASVVAGGDLLTVRLTAGDPRSAGRAEALVETVLRAHRWRIDWSASGNLGRARPEPPYSP